MCTSFGWPKLSVRPERRSGQEGGGRLDKDFRDCIVPVPFFGGKPCRGRSGAENRFKERALMPSSLPNKAGFGSDRGRTWSDGVLARCYPLSTPLRSTEKPNTSSRSRSTEMGHDPLPGPLEFSGAPGPAQSFRCVGLVLLGCFFSNSVAPSSSSDPRTEWPRQQTLTPTPYNG